MADMLKCVATAVAIGVSLPAAGAERIETRFDHGWRFIKQDVRDAQQPDFDDSAWMTVDVPHDWAAAGPFDPKAGGETGKLPWKGRGWYRKRFDIPAGAGDRRVIFLFGGIMSRSTVYVNGRHAGGWVYGYNSFWLDVTEHVEFGGENVIAIHVDTNPLRSRWYPGGGIYRKVRLIVTDAIRIPIWGVHVTTHGVMKGSRLPLEKAMVRVHTDVINGSDSETDLEVLATIADPGGKQVASRSVKKRKVQPGAKALFEHDFFLDGPQRWDVEKPNLYSVKTTVVRAGNATDAVATRFGLRSFEWTASDGFHLNGKRLQIKGVNLHHDNGPLGAADFRRASRRKLKIMKEMGVNAIRTSHNPMSGEFLDLCDEMGFVVFNEGFDKYGNAGYGCGMSEFVDRHAEREVRNFVLRDRNHPSVVIWSIGNEMIRLFMNWSEESIRAGLVTQMDAYFKKYDPSRPTTMGCNATATVGRGKHLWDSMDVTSWNYTAKYRDSHRFYPGKCVIYSESASAFSTRGHYEFPLPDGKESYSKALQESSYDMTAAKWADVPEHEFMRMIDDDYCAGEFVWTGFDYLGEPTPHNKTAARSSYFGIVDLVGFPKDRYYLYRSHWAPEKTTVHILPHWTWPEREGKTTPVFVYTNGDEAELFLNGRSLGRRAKDAGVKADLKNYYGILDRFRLRWLNVRYRPGELRAVAYRNGTKLAEAVMKTAGKPAALRLTPDRRTIAADGYDLCYVTVEMVDGEGNVCPRAMDRIAFSVRGEAARLQGIGNGNPIGADSFTDSTHPLFYGKAMLILRSTRGVPGTVEVVASADGVRGGRAEVVVRQ